MKLLVFASGRGSNFEAIVNASKEGRIPAQVIGLICDKSCNAMKIAEANRINVSVVKPKEFDNKAGYIKVLLDTVDRYQPDYILLAGYMRIIPGELIDRYPLRIINIHPSLLPAFPGVNSIYRAWVSRVKITGVTIHFVNDKVDQGVIIAQVAVPVTGDLEEFELEMHDVEHKLYVDTVRKLIEEDFDTLVVSKCLLEENCRYDGISVYSKRVDAVVNKFKAKIVKVCPELEAGFSVPRAPIDIVDGRAIMQDVGDVTDRIKDSVQKLTSDLTGSKRILAILKEKSPSCGTVDPMGFFTSALIKEFRDRVFIVTEEEL